MKHLQTGGGVCGAGRPFTGAWIETAAIVFCAPHEPSRPFTGAWIETSRCRCVFSSASVAPSRGRGLKQDLTSQKKKSVGRPFTGAWIETAICWRIRRNRMVAPSRGRGLKRLQGCGNIRIHAVAPSRGRGLKLHSCRRGQTTIPSPLHGGVD